MRVGFSECIGPTEVLAIGVFYIDISLTQSFIVTVFVMLTPCVLAVAFRTMSISLRASSVLTVIVAFTVMFLVGSAVFLTMPLNTIRSMFVVRIVLMNRVIRHFGICP